MMRKFKDEFMHWWSVWRENYNVKDEGIEYLAFTAGWDAAVKTIRYKLQEGGELGVVIKEWLEKI